MTKTQVKSAIVGEISPMSKLQQQVAQLTTLVKSAQVGPKKNPYKGFPKKNENQNNGNPTKDDNNGDIWMQCRGPETGPNGPFWPGQRPIQCYKCKGWGHPRRLCPSWLNFTGGDGKRESSPRPGKCGEPKSPGSSTPQSIIIKASQLAQRYHNPDPLLRLIGPANEAKVLVDNHEFSALIDSGAQLTQMSLSLVKKLRLPIHTLNTIVEVEPMGGRKVAYLGYVEARLKILGIKKMDKDSLFMVINDSPYTERVPIMIGTFHIRQAFKLATKGELN